MPRDLSDRPVVLAPESGEVRVEPEHAKYLSVETLYERVSNGLPLDLPLRQPRFGDETGARTLQQMAEEVEARREAFDRLPARIRRACGDDWRQLEFALTDRARAQELVDLGLQVEGVEPSKPSREAEAGPTEVETPPVPAAEEGAPAPV